MAQAPHESHCLATVPTEQAPNTLVLHTRAGNCFGDMAAYDFFSLGGPYSVRGYSPGELGACRRFLETAAEVRVPLKNHGLAGERTAGWLLNSSPNTGNTFHLPVPASSPTLYSPCPNFPLLLPQELHMPLWSTARTCPPGVH